MKINKMINNHIYKNDTLLILLGIIGFLILIVLYHYVYKIYNSKALNNEKIMNNEIILKEDFQEGITMESINGYYQLKVHGDNKYYKYGTLSGSSDQTFVPDQIGDNKYEFVFYFTGNTNGTISIYDFNTNSRVEIGTLEITILRRSYGSLKVLSNVNFNSIGVGMANMYNGSSSICASTSERGFNFAHQEKNQANDNWSCRRYDTHGHDYGDELRDYINNEIEDDALVMVGIGDEAALQYRGWAIPSNGALNTYRQAWKAIGSYPMAYETDFGGHGRKWGEGYRAGYAYIGIKKSDTFGGIPLYDSGIVKAVSNRNRTFGKAIAEINNVGQIVLSILQDNSYVTHSGNTYNNVSVRKYVCSFDLVTPQITYHSIPDGFYTIRGFKYLIIAINNTFEQYQIFKQNNGQYQKINRMDGDTFNLLSFGMNKFENNANKNTSINDFNKFEFINSHNKNVNNKNNSYNMIYFENDNKKYLLNSNNNNIEKFEIDMRINKRRIIEENYNKRVCFTVKRKDNTPLFLIVSGVDFNILKIINRDGRTGSPTLVSEYYNSDRYNNMSYDVNDGYYFHIALKPTSTSKYLIYQHLYDIDLDNNNNVKNEYFYLKHDSNNNIVVEKRDNGLLLDEMNSSYLFSFDEFNTSNNHREYNCIMHNNYLSSNENGINKLIHRRDVSQNQYAETNCRNYDIFNEYENCYGNKQGCYEYKPEFINQELNSNNDINSDTLIIDSYTASDGTTRSKYGVNTGQKFTNEDDLIGTFNNITIKKCQEKCDEDSNCYGFDYFKTLKAEKDYNRVSVNGTCRLIGTNILTTDDTSYNFYKIDVDDSGFRRPPAITLPPEADITAERVQYREMTCGDITNRNVCNTTNGCYYRNGNCSNLCEFNDDGTCKQHIANTTIGSLNDVEFEIVVLYVNAVENERGTNNAYLKLNIKNLVFKDPTKNLTFPVIRRRPDGLKVLFKCTDDTSEQNQINNDILVNYNLDYNSYETQGNLLNNNDFFYLDIPSDCNAAIEEYILDITFKDFYGIEKSFTILGTELYKDDDPESLAEYQRVSLDTTVQSQTSTVQYNNSLLFGLL